MAPFLRLEDGLRLLEFPRRFFSRLWSLVLDLDLARLLSALLVALFGNKHLHGVMLLQLFLLNQHLFFPEQIVQVELLSLQLQLRLLIALELLGDNLLELLLLGLQVFWA